MVCMRMVPLIPPMMMIGACTTHPCWVKSCGSMAYLLSLHVNAMVGNLSL